MEILFYEARNLFDNEEEYINAYEYIKNNLKLPILKYHVPIGKIKECDNGIILTVICFVRYIKEIDKNKISRGFYSIIIDQFKYKSVKIMKQI